MRVHLTGRGGRWEGHDRNHTFRPAIPGVRDGCGTKLSPHMDTACYNVKGMLPGQAQAKLIEITSLGGVDENKNKINNDKNQS